VNRGDQQPEDPYAELPEVYDLEHASFADDIELYLRLVEVVGDPVLELGCGSGRVLLPIADAGYRVTGIDRSGAMLERADQAVKTANLDERVTLAQMEMRDAKRAPGGPFGLVIVSLDGFLHLETQADQRAALTACREALDPRGMLVIDALHANPELLAAFDGRVQHEGTWQAPDGETVARFAARLHSPAAQRIETELWYDIANVEGALRRVRTRFGLRYVTAAELELMLELSGFVEWQLYGSYDLDPFEDESERILITAEVTAS
jgi:2-polyprenyl-3-methyl-5-hydroxy-6-metoxy-1,4-benzoquinol methylase